MQIWVNTMKKYRIDHEAVFLAVTIVGIWIILMFNMLDILRYGLTPKSYSDIFIIKAFANASVCIALSLEVVVKIEHKQALKKSPRKAF